ncbi:MAG TPA: DUF4293 domain-containing protein [Chitinophagaceae bacterium]|nr:DUF4293 domain-containing protein [Chitinophagaceae bacterium]
MIQRRQTLWLLLATAASILGFWFPFATGKVTEGNNMLKDVVIDAGSDFFLLIITLSTTILSTVIIFLFKNRKQQMLLCLLGLLLSVGLLLLYYLEIKKLEKYTLALSCILPLIVLISYFMAYRNIRKDEKLVKSLNKLR